MPTESNKLKVIVPIMEKVNSLHSVLATWTLSRYFIHLYISKLYTYVYICGDGIKVVPITFYPLIPHHTHTPFGMFSNNASNSVKYLYIITREI